MTRLTIFFMGLMLMLQPRASAMFRDITADAGITFIHHAAPEKKYIVESMSGGVALFDFDRDGLIDIYFVDSQTVDTKDDPRAARSALYRNLGNLRFEDVTDKAGVGRPGWGMGACVADIDGDGWPDLYVTALNGNHLYRNKHDGTFEDITQRAGVAVGGFSTGCGFADYDRDGDLDLFVSRYVHIDLDHLPQFGKDKTCEYRGIAVQCGPRGLPGETDFLFRNNGDGTFTDVTQRAGVGDPRGYYGLGVAWFDANGDGWPDLYVANDSTPNFLYLNQKNGTFKEMAMPLGVAVSADGQEQGSMGIALGDYDNSGRFSIFVTNFSEEYNALYHAEGGAGVGAAAAASGYIDASWRSKTASASLPYVGWGTAFFDYDNDGLLDLYVVNGHVYPQLDKTKLGASAGYRQRRLLYHNRGDGTFDEVAAQAGPVMMDERVSRGAAVADLDNDGRLDIVINDLDGAPQVLHNEVEPSGHWLIVALQGKPPNTLAIGTVVTARVGDRRMMRVVQSGTSYLSQDDMRVHFGLGSAEKVDELEMRWPDGTRTVLKEPRLLRADQILAIEQR
jgi:enediyne biosynthesis protein E4